MFEKLKNVDLIDWWFFILTALSFCALVSLIYAGYKENRQAYMYEFICNNKPITERVVAIEKPRDNAAIILTTESGSEYGCIEYSKTLKDEFKQKQ